MYLAGRLESVSLPYNQPMIHIVGVCPFCEVGSQAFRRCSDGTTIVVACNECSDVWMDPAYLDQAHVVVPDHRKLILPGTTLGLDGGAAGWATIEEIGRKGGARYITRSAER